MEYERLYEERMERLREISETTGDEVLFLLYLRANIVPLRRMFSWAVPNKEALETVRKYSPRGVCEIGAGIRIVGEDVARRRRRRLGLRQYSRMKEKETDTWLEDLTRQKRKERRRHFVQ
jgi:hypothetical protein